MAAITRGFNMDKLRQIIKSDDEKPQDREYTGPKTAFLPPGMSDIRFFMDPNGDLYREIEFKMIGRSRIPCIDSDYTKRSSDSPKRCGFCKIARATKDWRSRCRYNLMVYGYLESTKNEGDYWKAGNSYVILGNKRLRKSLLDVMRGLMGEKESEDYLNAMMTPTVKGPYTNVVVTSGQAGSVNINHVIHKTIDPIEDIDGDWYVPLDEVFVDSQVNHTKYVEGIKQFLEGLAESDRVYSPEQAEVINEVAAEIGEGPVPLKNVREFTPEELEAMEKDEDTIVTSNGQTSTTPSTFTPPGAEEKASPEESPVVETTDEVDVEAVLDAAEHGKTSVPEPENFNPPEGCPGWAMYNANQKSCQNCEEYIVKCMVAKEGIEI